MSDDWNVSPAERRGKRQKRSYLSKLWELDRDSRASKYIIRPHRSAYMLPGSYNHTPNKRFDESTR